MELLLCAWLPIWLLFGIATAMVAHNKGRDGCLWFFTGFIFGPFGLLFALIEKPGTVGMKKCPQCAEFVREEAKVCRFCGFCFGE